MDTVSTHIESTPGVAGGKPRVAGHRITIQNIVIWHERMGLSADEIVSQHPQISLSDVYAALAYYHDHRDEIRQEIDEDAALAEAVTVWRWKARCRMAFTTSRACSGRKNTGGRPTLP